MKTPRAKTVQAAHPTQIDHAARAVLEERAVRLGYGTVKKMQTAQAKRRAEQKAHRTSAATVTQRDRVAFQRYGREHPGEARALVDAQTDWHPLGPEGLRPLGDICTDTATLILCDPIHAHAAGDWDILEADTDENGAVALKDGNISIALALPTGLGDGVYRVAGRFEDVPGFGERLAEVVIRFLPHPQIKAK